LCLVYGISDEAERERLMTLAREGKQRGWWQKYDLPYATYVGLEVEATSTWSYTEIVPGLLQVDGYARAIFETGDPPLDQAAIELRTEARLRRQELLAREDDARFHFIVDEAALHRPIGGPAVMRAQIARIIEAARLPKVTFQVLPFAVGAHPAIVSNFALLEFGREMVSNIVYIEGAVGNIFLESAHDLERYHRIFSRIERMALNEADSIAMTQMISKTYK
jgi:hypothetical protein